MGKIKIGYFLNTEVRGGVEEHLLSLLKHLNREKFDPVVILPARLALLMKDDFEKNNIQYKEIYIRSWSNIKEIIRFIKFLKKEKFDIINPHLFFASRFAAPIAKLCGVPVVIETAHIREAWRKGYLKTFYGIDRFFSLFVNKYIAVSWAIKKYFVDVKKINPDKIEVVHNGIDLSKFNPEEVKSEYDIRSKYNFGNDLIAGVVARLEPQKGHRFFLDAAKLILKEFSGVKFLIVGEGNLEKDLRDYAGKLNISDNVIFAGYYKNIAQVLMSIDIFVLPSLYEGLPLSVIEASSMEKAIVATNVDGTPEIAVNGETGIIVEPENPEELKKAILFFLKSEEKRKDFGKKARIRVLENFSIYKQTRETELIYLNSLMQR
ncbi:glycosyltransferase [Candidatus Desantisbacteria bacterium]|nr:glycosyltransferase [Candidatus Desantisbacteria bacterium]